MDNEQGSEPFLLSALYSEDTLSGFCLFFNHAAEKQGKRQPHWRQHITGDFSG